MKGKQLQATAQSTVQTKQLNTVRRANHAFLRVPWRYSRLTQPRLARMGGEDGVSRTTVNRLPAG